MKFALLLAVGLWTAGWAQAEGLSIAHNAVPFAVRGQPLTLKAKVTGAVEPESVTLYYALFRDAAPFRVPMKSTGLGYYVGTIEASVVAGVDSFSYYLEAQDKNGSITETPWHEVPLRKAETKPAAATGGMPMPSPAGPGGPGAHHRDPRRAGGGNGVRRQLENPGPDRGWRGGGAGRRLCHFAE